MSNLHCQPASRMTRANTEGRHRRAQHSNPITSKRSREMYKSNELHSSTSLKTNAVSSLLKRGSQSRRRPRSLGCSLTHNALLTSSYGGSFPLNYGWDPHDSALLPLLPPIAVPQHLLWRIGGSGTPPPLA